MPENSRDKAELKKLFLHPTPEYRGTPFWAWNCRMTREKVDEALDSLKKMGMGGAFFHCRTGMDMQYLGPEFMQMMHYAHEKAGELGLLTCLYDEDRWPSGFAGGLVTCEERYRSRFLLFSPRELPLEETIQDQEHYASAEAVLSGKRTFLAKYGVHLNQGKLTEYGRFEAEEKVPANWDVWYAYLEVSGDSPWFNNQAYVNTLDPAAVRRFIEITYDAYAREFESEFGKSIPAIFTDEPQFSFKSQFGKGEEKIFQTIPYTDDFEKTYEQAYGSQFLNYLPEVFWEWEDGHISVHRYHYHDHVCQRFTESYADQIGSWCRNHHIQLTGHMMREPFLEWQTMALGEAMRSYRSFDVPGIDMLCDRRELTTAKQAQSAAHQYGAPGMTSEMYGVTNWDFDFRGHKLAGDWQAALGVTRRVHHLTWTSMAGEAKRDYPAPIGYQSPWYQEYPYIEDYFARINTVLTRGVPCVKIGVIHPIESYWLYWGPKEQTGGIREEREENFVNLVKWLLYGLLDFDFISEALLSDFEQREKQGFQVGEMVYDVVLIPDCVTLRSTTLRRLEEFSSKGGKVIFAGGIPKYIDGMPSRLPEDLLSRWACCRNIRYSRREILSELDEQRDLDIRNSDGCRSSNLLYQMRREGEERWLFVAHSEKTENPDLAIGEVLTFQVSGQYQVERWNPMTGSIEQVPVRIKDKKTCWEEVSYEHDSFLYHLISLEETPVLEMKAEFEKRRECWKEMERAVLPDSLAAVLEEPNVLLLDRAEYAFDDGPWIETEDILRIDNKFRKILGYPLRAEAYAQPWVNPARKEAVHRLGLKFVIESEIQAENILLGLEWTEQIKVYWNGIAVSGKAEGWYTDRDIRTISLGKIQKGKNILEVWIPYADWTQVENMYLLGDFGVRTAGKRTWITEPVRTLEFGDICSQGLPFYGGNLVLRGTFMVSEEERGIWAVQTSKFRNPLIRCRLDGKDKGVIALSPYGVSLGMLEAGLHTLEFRIFGNRVNTFGPVHNSNQTEHWIGPNAWRSSGTAWADQYQLKPTGILTGPRFFRMEEKENDSIYGK